MVINTYIAVIIIAQCILSSQILSSNSGEMGKKWGYSKPVQSNRGNVYYLRLFPIDTEHVMCVQFRRQVLAM